MLKPNRWYYVKSKEELIKEGYEFLDGIICGNSRADCFPMSRSMLEYKKVYYDKKCTVNVKTFKYDTWLWQEWMLKNTNILETE